MLRNRRQEDARRRSHPERCDMMFGEVVAEEPSFFGHLQYSHPTSIQLVGGFSPPFEVIKQTKCCITHCQLLLKVRRCFVPPVYIDALPPLPSIIRKSGGEDQ